MRAILWGVLLGGCLRLDPFEEAWNHVYAVDEMREGEGCEAPTASVEPPSPFVGIGYAAAFPDTVSLYWCPQVDSCAPTPWATFWVEDPKLKAIEGSRGVVGLTGGRLCSVTWDGAQATQQGDRLTLDVQQFSDTAIEVFDSAECDSILQAVFETTCTVSRSIEATRVP